MNASESAKDFGIDLSLIDESMRLTPEQRAIQHQAALELALQLEAAYRATANRRQISAKISSTLPSGSRKKSVRWPKG
jgi:hypothetical protein